MKGLGHNIKKYWRVFWRLRKIGAMNRLAYRASFVWALFGVGLMMSFNIIFLRIIFKYLGDLAGWGYYQALIVVGSFMIIDGLMWVLTAFVSPLSNHVMEGTLDGLLVKPIDPQFLISSWRGDLEDVFRLISGFALIFYSLGHLGFTFNQFVINFGFYLFLMLCAFLISYSICIMFRAIIFWVIEAKSLFQINQTLLNISEYPSDIFYHKIVRIGVLTVIPIAFLATVPAKVLAYGLNWKLIMGAFLVTIVFLFISRQFFVFALKYYSSASN